VNRFSAKENDLFHGNVDDSYMVGAGGANSYRNAERKNSLKKSYKA